MSKLTDIIRHKVETAFAPQKLELIDESHLHIGHAGARAGGESHFRLYVVSAAFEGVSRVNRQRQVFAVLAAEMSEQVHALALKLLTPAEAQTQENAN